MHNEEAIAQWWKTETAMEAAERIRKKYDVILTDAARKPLPRQVFDQM
jgi:hypothetical protein